MSDQIPTPLPLVSRDFTVAVFVIDQGCVLLHWHRKLARWLPPGGHIEPSELPDEAAVREVEEETGQSVRLLGGSGLDVSGPDLPRQLVQPMGIQLEDIGPGHQHRPGVLRRTRHPRPLGTAPRAGRLVRPRGLAGPEPDR